MPCKMGKEGSLTSTLPKIENIAKPYIVYRYRLSLSQLIPFYQFFSISTSTKLVPILWSLLTIHGNDDCNTRLLSLHKSSSPQNFGSKSCLHKMPQKIWKWNQPLNYMHSTLYHIWLYKWHCQLFQCKNLEPVTEFWLFFFDAKI
jgi:hypothetical protein